MALDIQICNAALMHLGINKGIVDADENSAEARACRQFYETAQLEVLKSFAWPFATRITDLQLVAEDPNGRWPYTYRYPANALLFCGIESDYRADTWDSRIPHKIIGDDVGQLILTDRPNARGEYTVFIDDTSKYSPGARVALGFLLAYLMAPRLTAGDTTKLGERAIRGYYQALRDAQSSAANEGHPDPEPPSSFERARQS